MSSEVALPGAIPRSVKSAKRCAIAPFRAMTTRRIATAVDQKALLRTAKYHIITGHRGYSNGSFSKSQVVYEERCRKGDERQAAQHDICLSPI